MSNVTAADVSRIVRDVLKETGSPASVLHVERESDGWHVRIRYGTDRIVTLVAPSGPAAAIRAAAQRFADEE